MKYYKSTSPLCVRISNNTNKVKNIKVFGSNFNDFYNNDIEPNCCGVSYSQMQKQLLNTRYNIGLIRFQCKSVNHLKKLIVSCKWADINGCSSTTPIIVGSYLKKGQVLKNVIDVNYPMKLNSSTELSMDVPANTEFDIYLFPTSKTDIEGKTIYSDGLVREITTIEHPFSIILYNKFKEAEKIKEKLAISDRLRTEQGGMNTCEMKFGINFSESVINEKIENLLIDLHNLPCDLYRNMVNLYVELDKYILSSNSQIKTNEDTIKRLKSEKQKIRRKILKRGKLVKASEAVKSVKKPKPTIKPKINHKNKTITNKPIKK